AKLGTGTGWGGTDQRLPVQGEGFDVVVAGELLEHVRFPDRLVAEVRRVLRPGGTFLGSVPNVYRLKSRLRFLFGRSPEFQDDPTHLHMYSERDLHRLLAYFEDVRVRVVVGWMGRLYRVRLENDVV